MYIVFPEEFGIIIFGFLSFLLYFYYFSHSMCILILYSYFHSNGGMVMIEIVVSDIKFSNKIEFSQKVVKEINPRNEWRKLAPKV